MSEKLPNGWCYCSIEQVASQVTYGSSAKCGDEENGVPVIRMGNIQDGRLHLENLKFLPKSHSEFPELLLQKGDILFNRTNSPELVGKTAVYLGIPKECSFASYLIRVRVEHCEPALISSYINSSAGRVWIRSQVQQQVGQANVNGSKLKALSIPLPPLNEQKRIVHKIEELQSRSKRAREALEKIPDLIEKFRQSVLASAFRGDLTREWREKNKDKIEPASDLLKRIRIERRKKWEEEQIKKFQAAGKTPKDDKWKEKYKEPEPVDTEGLPELPEGWCWASVDQLGFSNLGKMLDRQKHTSGHELPYLGNINVRWYRIETTSLQTMFFEADQIDRYSLRAGDVLVCEGGEPGRAAVCDESLTGMMYQKALHRVRLISYVQPNWLVHALRLGSWSGMMNSFFTGTTIRHLVGEQLARYPVPVAPLAEQNLTLDAITAAFTTIEGTSRLLETASQSLGSLDQSILAKAFRGELVPQDPDDEPASVLLERIRKEREAESSKKSVKSKGPKVTKARGRIRKIPNEASA